MNTQEILNVLKICGATLFGILAMHGYMTQDQASVIMGDLTIAVPALLSAGSVGWSIYAHWNMKKVPDHAVVVDPVVTKANSGQPTAQVQTASGTIVGKVVGALLIAFMLSAMAIAPAMAQVKLGPIGTKIKADIDGTSQNTAVGAPAPTIKPQELMQKIVALAAPDLVYAVALATKANTNAATVRLGCLKAIQALNAQVSGTGLVDATGNPLTTPAEPHIFTDLEQAAEGIDALSPTGPLFTSCAGAAALAGMNVLAFINAMVAGTAAAAIVVPK